MKSLLPLATVLALACQADSRLDVRADRPPTQPVAQADDDDDDEHEEIVAADAIPAHVRAAALAAVPGLAISEAELETSADGEQYCVHGHVGERSVEVEVDADGTVLSIEDDGDEDDEDDEDDD